MISLLLILMTIDNKMPFQKLDILNSYYHDSNTKCFESEQYNTLIPNDIIKYDIITDPIINTDDLKLSDHIINTDDNAEQTEYVEQTEYAEQIKQTEYVEQTEQIKQTEHKYCSKCHLKRIAMKTTSGIDIFDIVNKIIFDSKSMPDVYDKIDNLNLDLKQWFKVNEDGYTVFHWFAWFISTKIKKYSYVKPRVYAFFQKVFSDNTVESIFSKKTIKKIVKLNTPDDPNHTILYHLVRYCENSTDNYYKRLYQLLLDRGSAQLTAKQLDDIKKSNRDEDELPEKIRSKVSEITNNYKNTEDLIVKHIESKCPTYDLTKCIDCGVLIDYTKEISKIIQFAKKYNHDWLINLIYYAYYQRKLLNKIFAQVYTHNHTDCTLNMIHKRHEHVLNIYSNALCSN